MKELRALFSGVLVLAIVLAGVLGIAWAVGAQYQDAPETTTAVVDEAVTADVGGTSTVDAPDYAVGFEDNETIENSSGATLQEGTDYDWDTTSGEISWYDTPAVSDGEAMSVDYAYVSKTETARSLKTVLDVPITIVYPIAVLVVVAMSIAGLAAGLYAFVATTSSSSRTGRGSTFSRR